MRAAAVPPAAGSWSRSTAVVAFPVAGAEHWSDRAPEPPQWCASAPGALGEGMGSSSPDLGSGEPKSRAERQSSSAENIEMAQQVPEHDEDDDGTQTAAPHLLGTPTCSDTA